VGMHGSRKPAGGCRLWAEERHDIARRWQAGLRAARGGTVGGQTNKTSNPATAKPATSNDQSPKSKPSRRPPVAIRTLTEPSDIILLLGPDARRSPTASRGLVEELSNWVQIRSQDSVEWRIQPTAAVLASAPLPTRQSRVAWLLNCQRAVPKSRNFNGSVNAHGGAELPAIGELTFYGTKRARGGHT
jgi:hypothetical protein